MTALESVGTTTPLSVLTPDTLEPAERPTLYFLGVSTGSSSIQRVFPVWARELGIEDAVLRGIDLPVGAPDEHTRRIVDFLRHDELGVGMQITSHKIAVGTAARDLFAQLRPLATLMGEVSCVIKEADGLHGFAKDPVAGALALDAVVPAGYWTSHDAHAVVLGAGGAGTALTWCLVRQERGEQRPRTLVVTDTDRGRLDHLASIAREVGSDVPLELVQVSSTDETDAVLAAQPAGSLVVNATGLGKDLPGSPIGEDLLLPRDAIAWDLNYRGDLRFLETAIRQPEAQGVRAEDGWNYFVHGWLQAVKEVFRVDVPTSGPDFDRLSDLARGAR